VKSHRVLGLEIILAGRPEIPQRIKSTTAVLLNSWNNLSSEGLKMASMDLDVSGQFHSAVSG